MSVWNSPHRANKEYTPHGALLTNLSNLVGLGCLIAHTTKICGATSQIKWTQFRIWYVVFDYFGLTSPLFSNGRNKMAKCVIQY